MLIAPTRPDQAGVVTIEFLRDVYASLRTMCDFVIVDTPPGFTPEVIAAIDASTEICMVGMLDSLSLKNTKLGLETLELMGYDGERSPSCSTAPTPTSASPPTTSRRSSAGRPTISIPSDREIPRSVNEGTPIVRSKPTVRTRHRRSARSPTATRRRRAPKPEPLPQLTGRRPAH